MIKEIIVSANPDYPAAKLTFNGTEYDGVVGRNGTVEADKKLEGDAKTPMGSFKILAIYYRPDRISKIASDLPVYEIRPNDIWVDDKTCNLYNKPAKLGDIKSGISYERLYRKDHLYDIFLELDYNRNPVILGKGSAIFLHVARDKVDPKVAPTLGCIAVRREDLLNIVKNITDSTVLTVI